MSGECERCSEHCLDCTCSKLKKFEEAGLIGLEFKNMIEIEESYLLDLIHYARRYCDERCTFAPRAFNHIYNAIMSKYPYFIRCGDKFDATLKDQGKYWPYSQDGDYDEKTGNFDARPKEMMMSDQMRKWMGIDGN